MQNRRLMPSSASPRQAAGTTRAAIGFRICSGPGLSRMIGSIISGRPFLALAPKGGFLQRLQLTSVFAHIIMKNARL